MIHDSYMHAMVLERPGARLKAIKLPIPVAANSELLIKAQACDIGGHDKQFRLSVNRE